MKMKQGEQLLNTDERSDCAVQQGECVFEQPDPMEIVIDLAHLERQRTVETMNTLSNGSASRSRSLEELQLKSSSSSKTNSHYSSSLFNNGRDEEVPDGIDLDNLAISPIPQRLGNSNIEIPSTINNANALSQPGAYHEYPSIVDCDDDDDDEYASSRAPSTNTRSSSRFPPFTGNARNVREDGKPLQVVSAEPMEKDDMQSSSSSSRRKICLLSVVLLLIIIVSVIVAILTKGGDTNNQDPASSSSYNNFVNEEDDAGPILDAETLFTQEPTGSPSSISSSSPSSSVVITPEWRLQRIPQKLSWQHHKSTAAHMGCTLASVRDAQEQAWMETFFSGERFWIGADFKGNSFKWSDGTSMNYTNWWGEAITTGDENSALAMDTTTSNNYWMKEDKSQLYSAVYRCPFSYNYVMVEKKQSWSAHGFSANIKKCTFASIDNKFEQMELERILSMYPDNLVWIGAKRTGQGAFDWQWLDDTSFQYTNWQQGQPTGGGALALDKVSQGGNRRFWTEVQRETELMAVYRCV